MVGSGMSSRLGGLLYSWTRTAFTAGLLHDLGKIGVSLVEKEFDKLKLNGIPLSEGQLTPFYDNLTRAAKLVAGPSKIEVMVDEMKKGVRTLLKGS